MLIEILLSLLLCPCVLLPVSCETAYIKYGFVAVHCFVLTFAIGFNMSFKLSCNDTLICIELYVTHNG